MRTIQEPDSLIGAQLTFTYRSSCAESTPDPFGGPTITTMIPIERYATLEDMLSEKSMIIMTGIVQLYEPESETFFVHCTFPDQAAGEYTPFYVNRGACLEFGFFQPEEL